MGRMLLALVVLTAGLAVDADQRGSRPAPPASAVTAKPLPALSQTQISVSAHQPMLDSGSTQSVAAHVRSQPGPAARAVVDDSPEVNDTDEPGHYRIALLSRPDVRDCTHEDLRIEFTLNRSRYEPGDVIRIWVRMRHSGSEPCVIVYPALSVPIVELRIEDNEQTVVWTDRQCQTPVLYSDAISYVLWKPGTVIAFETSWDQQPRRWDEKRHSCVDDGPRRPGAYKAIGIFPGYSLTPEYQRIDIPFCIDPVALPWPASLKEAVWSASDAPGAQAPCLDLP